MHKSKCCNIKLYSSCANAMNMRGCMPRYFSQDTSLNNIINFISFNFIYSNSFLQFLNLVSFTLLYFTSYYHGSADIG